MEAPAGEPPAAPRPRASRFRFKDKRSRRHPDDSHSRSPPARSRSRSRSRSPAHSRSHRRHRHRRKHHRRHRSPTPPPASPPLSPNAAFRESLFDALADDEGAAYWEGVYGQPIHTYARPATAAAASAAGEPAPPTHDADGNPHLEQLNDDEYAAYVRACMWEKSHQHIIEERARREQARAAERERRQQRQRHQQAPPPPHQTGVRDDGADRWAERDEEGEARRWARRWQRYIEGWAALDRRVQEAGEAAKPPRIPFPTASGSAEDISPTEVERFFRSSVRTGAAAATMPESGTTAGSPLRSLLKAERVRWHPDKMAHRYGILGVLGGGSDGARGRRAVTAVFQAVDALYGRVLEEEKAA